MQTINIKRRYCIFANYPNFVPNYSPLEMLQLGVYNGPDNLMYHLGNLEMDTIFDISEASEKEAVEIAEDNYHYQALTKSDRYLMGTHEEIVELEIISREQRMKFFNWYIMEYHGDPKPEIEPSKIILEIWSKAIEKLSEALINLDPTLNSTKSIPYKQAILELGVDYEMVIRNHTLIKKQ